MMAEVTEPYHDASNGMSTAYGAVYVPAAHVAEVVAWLFQARAGRYYEVDVLFLPLTGDTGGDYTRRAWRGFNSAQWRFNTAIINAGDNAVVDADVDTREAYPNKQTNEAHVDSPGNEDGPGDTGPPPKAVLPDLHREEALPKPRARTTGDMGLPKAVRYYLANNSYSTNTSVPDVRVTTWLSAAAAAVAAPHNPDCTRNGGCNQRSGSSGGDSSMPFESDWAISPPYQTQITLSGRTPYPAGSFILDSDAYYIVIAGNGTFGTDAHSSGGMHNQGDVYWVMAGQMHGW